MAFHFPRWGGFQSQIEVISLEHQIQWEHILSYLAYLPIYMHIKRIVLCTVG